MIRLILVLALAAASFPVFAQRVVPVQHSIYVGGGLSMPPESLAGIESIDNKGYVENGPTFSVSYLVKWHRYIGVGATIGHSRNNLNEDAMIRAIPSAKSIQTEPYTLTFLTADVYGILPLQQWQLYIKGGLGSIVPNKWEVQGTNEYGTVKMKSGSEFVPAYTGAFGVNYTLGKIDVGLESGLLASKPEFEIDSGKNVTYRKQWLSSFNYTIKTGFRF